MDSCVRACEEALTVITTMAMSSDRRYGSAIDYMLLQISLLSVRVLSDVHGVFPEHTESAHQLMEWRMDAQSPSPSPYNPI